MSLLLHVDGLVQRRFDHLVHAVMRRTGATKRVMRREGWKVAIYAICISLVLRAVAAAPMLGMAFTLLVHLGMAVGDDISDQRAEQHEMMSLSDEMATWRKGAGFVLIAVATLMIVMGLRMDLGVSGLSLIVAVTLALGAEVICSLVWLYQGYLCRTSPRVPPQKEREPKLVLVSCPEVA